MENAKKLYESLSNFTITTEDPILQDPHSLCQTLFKQLHYTFRQFLNVLSLRRVPGRPRRFPPPPHLRLRSIVQHLSLLIRCCLLLLTLPLPDQKFFLLKCRDLLRLLHSFLSADVTEHQHLRFRNFIADDDVDIPDSSRPFFIVLLEVFADELLRHQSLRRYLMIADSVSSIHEKLFVCHFPWDITCVLEVLSTHFILSVSNKEACEDFTSRLFSHCDKDLIFHELSLAPSTMLLLDPVFLSAPKMFQAHIISMVSEAISSGLTPELLASDMDCHLTALQKSVDLYCMHVSSLQIDGFCVKLKCSYNSYLLKRGQPTFESCIQQSTRNRLNQVLSKSDKSWDSSYQCKISSKTKADLLAEYIAFMKERQFIFVDSRRDVTTSILDCIINQAFSQDATGGALYNIKENTNAQDICLLASILKLMSVLLLQAIKYLSNSSDSDCLKTMGSAPVREKYDILISIIDQFQQFEFCLPIQTFLYDDMTENLPSNYKVSKSMLVHFIGLLSLSFSSGLDLLAKGCISVLMALMYLFDFEEGDLVALGSLKCLSLQPGSSEKSGKGTRDRQTVYKVAAEFRRIQACNLRTDSFTSCNLVEDGTDKTYNAKMFLNCIFKDPKKESDFDELADFFECKTEKKYSKWLNDRKTYRKWRRQKKMDSRKNKKETFLKSYKSKKIGKLFLKGLDIFTFMKHWRG